MTESRTDKLEEAKTIQFHLLLRTILNPATKQIHVRAQFDYNPLEDEFIPCAQAGVAFKIGDILQVILLR